MTSRERFEKWASEYGFAYELIDAHQYAKACAWDAWQAAEKQALERAIEVLEADRSGLSNQSRARDVIDACCDTIRALKDQP